MRPNQPRLAGVAVWLGVVALSLNALAPMQLVFGLATNLTDARECGHYEGDTTVLHQPGWWAFVLLIGQDDIVDPSHAHKGLHPGIGAAYAATGTPTSFAPPTITALSLPKRLEQDRHSTVVAENEPQATISAYRSRAPPSDS